MADLGASFDRLLDAFEEGVRAHLEHPDIGPAAARRLRRLLPAEPAPAPPPTADRLALADALSALRLTVKRAHPRDQPQVRGAITRIRNELGLGEEVPPPSVQQPEPASAPDPKPAADIAMSRPAPRGAAAA